MPVAPSDGSVTTGRGDADCGEDSTLETKEAATISTYLSRVTECCVRAGQAGLQNQFLPAPGGAARPLARAWSLSPVVAAARSAAGKLWVRHQLCSGQ